MIASMEKPSGPSLEEMIKVAKNVKPDPIEEKAREIIEDERILEFYIKTCHEYHCADEGLLMANYLTLPSAYNLGDQLHIWNIGSSGKGKSHLAYTACIMMPQDMVEIVTSVSPRAFLYMEHPEQFYSKVLLIDDFELNQEGISILKNITSNSEINARSLCTDKKITGERITKDLKFSGRVPVIMTSTKMHDSPELRNRFIAGNIDESDRIDREVFEHNKRIYGAGIERGQTTSNNVLVMRKIGEIQFGEKKVFKVEIPFHERIDTKVRDNRRDLPRFMTLIKCNAILNWRHRNPKVIGNNVVEIEATEKDFIVANAIWSQVCEISKSHVPQKALDILHILPTDETQGLTRKEIANLLQCSSNTVKNHLDILYPNGYVECKRTEEYGPTYRWWKVKDFNYQDLAFYLKPNPANLAKMQLQGYSKLPCNTQLENQSLSNPAINQKYIEGLTELKSNKPSSLCSTGTLQGSQSEPIYASSSQTEPQNPCRLENAGSCKVAGSNTGTQLDPHSTSEWKGLQRPPIYTEIVADVIEEEGEEKG